MLNLKHRENGASKPLTKSGRKPPNFNWRVTPEILAKIETYAARNLNKEEICYCLDISLKTLERRVAEDPDVGVAVDEAIKRGRSKGKAVIVNRLYEDAKQPGRLGAQAFYLKNTQLNPWRDNAAVEVTGKGGEPLIPAGKEYTDDQRAIRIASILDAARERRAKRSPVAKKRRD